MQVYDYFLAAVKERGLKNSMPNFVEKPEV